MVAIGQSQASRTPAIAVDLWSARAVAWLTFFFGLPTGLILAIQNWRAVEDHDAARNHTIGAVVAFLVYLAVLVAIPSSVSGIVTLAINIIGIVYLRSQAQHDIDDATGTNRYVNTRNAWLGVLIGIGVSIAVGIIVAVLVGVFGIRA